MTAKLCLIDLANGVLILKNLTLKALIRLVFLVVLAVALVFGGAVYLYYNLNKV